MAAPAHTEKARTPRTAHTLQETEKAKQSQLVRTGGDTSSPLVQFEPGLVESRRLVTPRKRVNTGIPTASKKLKSAISTPQTLKQSNVGAGSDKHIKMMEPTIKTVTVPKQNDREHTAENTTEPEELPTARRLHETRVHKHSTNPDWSEPPDTPMEGWQTVKSKSSKRVNRNSNGSSRPTSATNKFSALQIIELEPLEGTSFVPIEVLFGKRTSKHRQKQKPKIGDLQSFESACVSHQEIRHPHQAIRHVSPEFGQYLLTTQDSRLQRHRDRLIHQIALLRAARTRLNNQQLCLQDTDDTSFLLQVAARASCTAQGPSITERTRVVLPLRAILNNHNPSVDTCIAFSWLDLATRALLPSIYATWPQSPPWFNGKLTWLPSPDKLFPCLTDEALSTLSTSPILTDMWTRVGSLSPELTHALHAATAMETTPQLEAPPVSSDTHSQPQPHELA